jgi:hypothetical protein
LTKTLEIICRRRLIRIMEVPMYQGKFTIGNAIYLSMALGMLSATAMNFLVILIFRNEEDFYIRLIVIFLLICLSAIILTSRKFRAIIRVWNNYFPEEDHKRG